MPDIVPTTHQRLGLTRALNASFPDWGKLASLSANGLGFNLNQVASPFNPQPDTVNQLITWAQANSKVAFLVDTARAFNPDNDLLVSVATELGFGPVAGHDEDKLQSFIDPDHEIQPIVEFNSKLGRAEYHTCQIEYPVTGGRVFGTGFLAARNLVLTCYHVMSDVIEQTRNAKPENVIVRFDYKTAPPGVQLRQPREVKLSGNWLVDKSEPDPADRTGDEAKLLGDDKLDYAVLQLAEPVGEEPIAPVPGSPDRDWVRAAPNASIAPPQMLFILQHPEGKAQGIAFEGPGVERVIAKGTRFRHLVNTRKGSSGAPCYDREVKLVGLHHSGDTSEHPTWNQAVAIGPLRAAIHAKGHTTVLA